MKCVDGGWAYYDFDDHTQKPSGSSIRFVTAAVLVALHDAKLAGVDVPQRLIDRAIASILRQRKPDFSIRLRRVSEVSAAAADQSSVGQPRAVRRRATWRCGSGAIGW